MWGVCMCRGGCEGVGCVCVGGVVKMWGCMGFVGVVEECGGLCLGLVGECGYGSV